MQTINTISPFVSGAAMPGNPPSPSSATQKEDTFSVHFKQAGQGSQAPETDEKSENRENATGETSEVETLIEVFDGDDDMENPDKTQAGYYDSEIELPEKVPQNAEGAMFGQSLAENSGLALGAPQTELAQGDSDKPDLAHAQKRMGTGDSTLMSWKSEVDGSDPGLRTLVNPARDAEAIEKPPTQKEVSISSEMPITQNNGQRKTWEGAQSILGNSQAGTALRYPAADVTLDVEEFQAVANRTDFAKPPVPAVNATKVGSYWQAGGEPYGIANVVVPQADIDQLTLVMDQELSEELATSLPASPLQNGSFSVADGMLARPETARMVAVQIADAMIKAQNNKIEIALNPEELGRVRMVLTSTDTGVSVSIVAERPETLDMMRRHIDQLAEEFRKLGYEDIGFEFSGGGASGTFDKDGTDIRPESSPEMNNDREPLEPGPVTIVRAIQSRGLDMRL